MIEDFEKLGLNEELLEAVESLKIAEPTEIQEKAIPVALDGKSIIGQSETGTGKTLAYLLPILQRIDSSKQEMQCIILAPTHELVAQINNTVKELIASSGSSIKSTSLIGSANIKRQMDKLKEKPQILVGSSGRVLELIGKKKITTHTIKVLVMDEGDKLLDKNNIDNVKKIVKLTPNNKQTMLFSATLANDTLSKCKELVGEAEVIRVKASNKVNENISHVYFLVEHRDKIEALRKLINAAKPEKALVFINSSYDVNMTLSKLQFNKIKAEALHGVNFKENRQKALEDFRKGKIQVLVASDIAARGLDIKGITHVINLDIPEDPKDYLHRVGRVGRAGEKGVAYSIVTEREEAFIKQFEKNFNINIEKKQIYMAEIVDQAPKYKAKKDKYANKSKTLSNKKVISNKKNAVEEEVKEKDFRRDKVKDRDFSKDSYKPEKLNRKPKKGANEYGKSNFFSSRKSSK